MSIVNAQLAEGCVWEHVSEDVWVAVNGDYLLLRCRQDPLQIYRQAAADRQAHPCISRLEYGRQLYTLAWIEGDEC